MVLALALPTDFPSHEQIVGITFAVVTLPILGHGLTMLSLLRRLGIVHAEVEPGTYDVLRGELQASAAVLEEADRARKELAKKAVKRNRVHEQDV